MQPREQSVRGQDGVGMGKGGNSRGARVSAPQVVFKVSWQFHPLILYPL